MSDQTSKRLLQFTRETYQGSFNKDLLEQYKVYVQSAENVSSRRIASIRYFLTLNAALVAFYGFQPAGFGSGYWTLVIPVVGVLVSCIWYSIIKSHADLNQVKFDVIHEFESHLPAAMYQYEWQLAENGRGKTYRAVTTIERWIPILFIVLYTALAVFIVLDILGVVSWRK